MPDTSESPRRLRMPLDAKLIHRLHQALGVVDEHGTVGPRWIDDANRLWDRVRRFIGMSLVPSPGLDLSALELACFALQLPQRRPRNALTGRPTRATRATLRERCEDAAELLIGVAGADATEELLDRTVRVLHEMPHRSPMIEEAKLLADAFNLEDFGITGLLDSALETGRHGASIVQLADSLEKREQYGYWDSRLKDGFHFEPIRQLATKRLEGARKVAEMLRAEMHEDKL